MIHIFSRIFKMTFRSMGKLQVPHNCFNPSKKHFCSLKQQFILYIDFCGAISPNTVSVAPSMTIQKNDLFHSDTQHECQSA
jgi:hypothetical protein